MKQYIVLQPLSPEQGPLILPAQVDPRDPDATIQLVIVDETIISDEAAPILIAAGVIALVDPAPAVEGPASVSGLLPGSTPDAPAEPSPRRRKP
jgi:hypothetical protein